MRTELVSLLVLLLLAVSVRSAGAQGLYFIAPDGHDENPGTHDAPWATLAKVSAEVRAGDTVIFVPGVYQGVLNPSHSGSEEAPITFRAAERRSVKLQGEVGAPFAIRLDGVSHIVIDGMHMDSATTASGWLEVNNAAHITLRDSLLENSATRGMPLLIKNSEHLFILDNEIRRWSPDWKLTNQIQIDMIRIEGSRRVVLEGNSISHALHTPLAFRPQSDGRNEYIVVRGNVFHNGWGRNYELFGTDHVLFEGNLLTNAFAGARSADTQSKFSTEQGTFRFNRVYANWGGADIFTADWVDASSSEIRVYNNVFASNAEFGLKATSKSKDGRRLFVNNAIVGNDAHGVHTHVAYTLNDSNLHFTHNLIWADQADAKLELPVQLFTDTVFQEPRFIDPTTGNFIPRPDSPMREAGRPLTKAVGNGTGTTLPVEDAAYFYDGFGITGELGDLIAVGHVGQVARITEVDYSNNVLTLDRNVSWRDGDSVSFPWIGEAPDIGVFEPGRPYVQVVASALEVTPGEPVALQAELYAIEPAAIQWHLGDGTIKTGPFVTHTYAEPGDYAVRVRVTDQSGRRHLGTGFVVAQGVDRDRLSKPLLAFDFDAQDTEWWKFWKAYRPFPAQWSRVIDPATQDGYLKIDAPQPESGTMPAWIYPVGWNLDGPLWWNVDEYPYVYMRYRIEPGTPIALYVQGFAGMSGRQAILASARSHKDTSVSKAANHVLFDDGQWHEITVDVRAVRDIFDDLETLQGVGLQTAQAYPANRGSYGISEFRILPASHPISSSLIRITQPQEHANLSGEIQVSYAIEGVSADEAITVTVEMGGYVLGESDLLANEMTIDTRSVSDGEQVLNIHATTQSGERFASAVWVHVQNRWSDVDHLQSPLSLFGQTLDRSKTSAMSPGWSYDDQSPGGFFGDTSRLVRSTNSTEYLEWQANRLIEITVELYTRLHVAEVAPLVVLSGSADKQEWEPLRRRIVETGRSDAGWRKVVITGSVPTGSTMDWVRLTLLEGDARAEEIQLGSVTLSGWIAQP